MKVILMTGTPIYDGPDELALVMNLFRPRISLPSDKETFNSFFVSMENGVMKLKNKICLQYLISGYISFSEGAHPKGYPFRRNHIKLHKMEDIQLGEYINAVVKDFSKDSESERKPNKLYEDELNNQEGRFIFSRQVCCIALPEVEVRASKNRGKVNLNSLFDTLRKYKKQEILHEYGRYSKKFRYIVDKIIQSGKNEGPIFVYSEWIHYGVLAISKLLDLLGWKFITEEDLEKDINELMSSDTPRYAIWSPSALEYMGVKKQAAYVQKLRNLFNNIQNKDGQLCKVIFSTVTEGISLKYISQIHIINPWWNNSEIEQAIGRGIRSGSHLDLE
jgi:hypothetical protein